MCYFILNIILCPLKNEILTEHENTDETNEWTLNELYELTPGFYTWTLTVTDNNGNVIEVSGSFTIDPEDEDPGELLGTSGIPGYPVDLIPLLFSTFLCSVMSVCIDTMTLPYSG